MIADSQHIAVLTDNQTAPNLAPCPTLSPPFPHPMCSFLPGQCRVEVPPQHVPPLLALQAPESLLQGEQAAVVVTVQVAADAVHGAVLAARALHVESQQELGLLPLAGSAGEPHTEPALDSTEGGQPAAASSPGAQPGEQLGGSRVPLGELLPGQLRQLALLLDARYRGTVELAAELQVGYCGTGCAWLDASKWSPAGAGRGTLGVVLTLPRELACRASTRPYLQ